MNIKQRHFIKSSEIKDLKEDILKQYNQPFLERVFPPKSKVELILTEKGDTLYAVNNELKLWKSKEHGFIPVLTQLVNNKLALKKVVVDMGAIKFITINAADIMRPGITKIDPSIKRGDIIEIVDETHGRSLAIGKAMYDADEMEKKDSGKVIKNLHTIQDSVWEFEKQFK
jgi:PUA-domain protein